MIIFWVIHISLSIMSMLPPLELANLVGLLLKLTVLALSLCISVAISSYSLTSFSSGN